MVLTQCSHTPPPSLRGRWFHLLPEPCLRHLALQQRLAFSIHS